MRRRKLSAEQARQLRKRQLLRLCRDYVRDIFPNVYQRLRRRVGLQLHDKSVSQGKE